MEFSVFMLPCYREGVAPSLGRFYDEIIEAVALADQLGWDRAWNSEHHFHYYGGAVPNPAMMLLAFARATSRIRLGSGISLLPMNNAIRVAEDYAMLDQLSGGRLDFGVGRGYLPHEFKGFGVTEDQTAGRFDEAFEIIQKAWSGEPFGFEGTHYRFEKMQFHPQPKQNPVPVWCACSRSQGSFEWTGRNGFALMMNQYPMSRADMETRFAWFKDAHAAAGHDPAERRAMMSLFLHIADSEEQAIAEAKPSVQEHANLFRLLFGGQYWSTEYEGDPSVFEMIGGKDGDVTPAFRERTAIGTVDQICERIETYRDLGFTEMSLVVRYGMLSHETALKNIRLATERILPRFRQKKAA
jgi:natural product biosynthesis luciferase-like monooxygenase protein